MKIVMFIVFVYYYGKYQVVNFHFIKIQYDVNLVIDNIEGLREVPVPGTLKVM
jgi:hypothetical protein